jgi:hypothetical protein
MYDIQLFYGYVFSRCVFDTVVRKHLPDLDTLTETTSYENAVASLFSKNIGVRTSYDILAREDHCSEVYVYLIKTGFDVQRDAGDTRSGSKILDDQRFTLIEEHSKGLEKELEELGLLGLELKSGWTLIH